MTIIDRRYSVAEGQALKAPCKVATTANIALAGEQTIDGVLVQETSPPTRVLVKDQTSAVDNGIYDVSTGNWTRARDFDGPYDVVTGTRIYVTNGTGVGEYVVSTTGSITVGTTAITIEVGPAQASETAAEASATAAAAAATLAGQHRTAAETAETNAETAQVAAEAAQAAAEAASEHVWYINVVQYGAVADCKFISDGAISTGTNALTSASNPFAADDVGKTVCIGNARQITSSPVTLSIASPCVVSWTGHGQGQPQAVYLTTTGSLPTGITAGTVYYVKNTGSADNFQISATPGGAAINTSGSQSGTHTAHVVGFLEATISAYNSAGSVNISTNASATATGAKVQWGTDNTDAFNDAIAALTKGGTVYVPCGHYMVGSINLTETVSKTLRGAAWGIGGDANPGLFGLVTGSVLVPINRDYAVIDLCGSAGVRVEDLQIGSALSPVLGSVAILQANSDTYSSDGNELRNLFVIGRWDSSCLYCYGTAPRIWHSRFWNYFGGVNGYAAVFTRDNAFSRSSNYCTIATGATGNPAAHVYECEFHAYTGGVTVSGALYLRGALFMFAQGSSFDSSNSASTEGTIIFDVAGGTDNIMTAINCTFYTEASPAPQYSLYAISNLTYFGFRNAYTFTSARKGGGGTITYGTLDS